MVILIKIILLTPYYYPIIGGITTFVDNLQKSFLKRGHTVIVITHSGENNDHIKVLRYNKYLFLIKSYQLIRKEKSNVLHSHSHWFVLAPCILYKFFHPKTTVIHTFHTEPINRVRGIKKKIIELLLFKCDFVIFDSKDLQKKIERNFKIKSHKKVIYAGVSIKEINKAERNRFLDENHLKDKKPIISFIGPLAWKMKVEGVKILIEAFSIIEKSYPNAKLLIVGEGEYRKDLENLCKKKSLSKKVIFTGFVKSAYTPLSVTDIYAHISLQEGLPISLIDAMGAGKPVVASNAGGIPELIINGTTGIIVDPIPEKIAKEIVELYNDEKKMKRFGKEAKKSVVNNFTWSKTAEQYLQLYNVRASK